MKAAGGGGEVLTLGNSLLLFRQVRSKQLIYMLYMLV